MSWNTTCVGDVCKYTTSGGTPRTSVASYYEPPTVPWLKTKEVNYCRIYQTESYISQEGLDNSSAKLIPENSVIVAMYGQGDTAGRVAINKIPVSTNQACCNLIIDPEKADYEFVYYALSTLYEKLVSLKNGGAQPNLNAQIIRSVEIPFPPLETQHKIAAFLSAYDDLIENNQKQIKLLEEAAQRLYKEWFVDLRFPGHETTPIVDGVPEGWKVDRADTFFNMSIGKTPPRAEKQWFTDGDKGTPWISISDMGNSGTYVFHSTEGLTAEAISKHNVRVVPADTILVSFKLTVGRVSITTTNTCTNEAIAHFLIPDGFLREYTYLYLKCFEYDSLGNTSAISKAVNSKIIKAMPFVMPDSEILQRFHQVGKPILEEIKNKQKTNIYLAEARDRLLPKLMSGEIEV